MIPCDFFSGHKATAVLLVLRMKHSTSPSLRELFVKSVQSVFESKHHASTKNSAFTNYPCNPCNPCSINLRVKE